MNIYLLLKINVKLTMIKEYLSHSNPYTSNKFQSAQVFYSSNFNFNFLQVQ